jgi:hypothetical protein
VTVKDFPPIVSTPVRAAPVFGAMLTTMVPLPVPPAGLLVIHDSEVLTPHEQADPAIISIVRVPPDASVDPDVGNNEIWHAGAASR